MLSIDRAHADEIKAHALEEDPNECCGILAGRDEEVSRLYRIINTTKSPVRYVMDPQEQFNAMIDSEREGLEFLAFYHSHTHSPAFPSQTDVRMALQSGYLDVYYLIVSLESKAQPHIRAFRINGAGDITEESFRIA